MSHTGNAHTVAWHSDLEGWRSRASALPDSESFTPEHDTLILAALYNAPVDPEGFTLALFGPDIAVDASGAVLRLPPHDFAGLVRLARDVYALPDTGAFRNQWRVNQPMTSRPIDRLFVRSAGGNVRETSVYGWAKGSTALSTPVDGQETLPGSLYELVGLVREARAGYEKGRGDQAVIDSVKALLGDEI